MHLEGSSFILRPHRWGDEESIARYANNRNISRNMADAFPYPYTVEDARSFIGRREQDPEPKAVFAIARDDEVIGGIGFFPGKDTARVRAEIGYWVAEPFWRQGIATEALRLVSHYAFEHFDLVRLQAMVKEWNPASMRVLEKAGYTLEARLAKSCIKDGQIIDEFLYVLLK
jgi:RimJ/RimL family protein N-acetyltransferase